MTEALRSKEQQLAALQGELKSLRAELDNVLPINVDTRNQIQREIDNINQKIDAIGNTVAPTEVSAEKPKQELSTGDMVRLVVELGELKKTHDSLNPWQSDKQRVKAEMDKISAELKNNGVDTENRQMMLLIEANLRMAKELDELRKGQGSAGGGGSEAVDENNKVPEEMPDYNEDVADEKAEESQDLLEFNQKLDALNAAANALRQVLSSDVATVIEDAISKLNNAHTEAGDSTLLLVDAELTSATQRLEDLKLDELLVEAKNRVAELSKPAVDEDSARAEDENTEDAGESAGEPKDEGEPVPPPAPEQQEEKKPRFAKLRNMFRKIWGVFTIRDESDSSRNETADEKKDSIATIGQMEKELKRAESMLQAVDLNLADDLVRTMDLKDFRRVDSAVGEWIKLIEGDRLSATVEEADRLKKRAEAIRDKVADQKKRLAEKNVTFT